jgi:hypothetical protein
LKAETGACEQPTNAQGQQANNNRLYGHNQEEAPSTACGQGKNQNIPPRLGDQALIPR